MGSSPTLVTGSIAPHISERLRTKPSSITSLIDTHESRAHVVRQRDPTTDGGSSSPSPRTAQPPCAGSPTESHDVAGEMAPE
jgi:hypothetical protein